jgi:putative ABC transport system permease protein
MPDWKAVLTRWLADRRVDPVDHGPVIEELSQHLDDRYRSLIARGTSPTDAESSVLEELESNDGNDALERELRRAARTRPSDTPIPGAGPSARWLGGCWQDVRYAARTLWRSPGFTSIAVVTLALGVGATTAIFSIVHAVMLRPLPYPEPERLVRIWESNAARGWPLWSMSEPNFLDFRARATMFDAIAASTGQTFTMTGSQGAEIVRGNRVTADFLPVLGVLPAMGRNFAADEDRPGGNVRVTILTHGFWQRSFGSDQSIVARTLALDGANYLIIGILPPSFQWGSTDLLVPLAPNPEGDRDDHRLTAIGRLRHGISIGQAHSELATIAAALGEQYPESNKEWSVRLASFYDWLIPEPTRRSLGLLFAAVGVLLLIACANVASLMLARGSARRKELSIRLALGAARWRISRQLLTESLLLAFASGLAGLAVGAAATRLLVAYGPATLPRLGEARLDATVVAFGLATAIATVLVFGLVPAIQESRQRAVDTLREGTRGGSSAAARQRFRSALIIVEVALSVTLLIGAGLLFRSFWRLQQVEPGFDVATVMTARIRLPSASYGVRAREAFIDRLLSEIRALPGVVSAATSSAVPLTAGNTSTEVRVPGVEIRDGARPSAGWRLVSPGYFATMDIPLRGRDFSPRDVAESRSTVIISEAMARAYWPDRDPIGLKITPSSFGSRERTIIGVAGDGRSLGLDAEPPRTLYFSTAQLTLSGTQLVWRSSGDPASHVAAVRDIIRRIDPGAPLYEVRSMNDLRDDSFNPRRFNMYLLGVFAGTAVLLAAIGLFGVMAYLVSQRTAEIGVRMALGADRLAIVRLILGRGLVLSAAGAGIGIGLALGLTRAMQSLLYSVTARDPATFVAVPVLLVAVALAACYLPARRAMNVDPVTALRAE